ncbi:MAG: dipeptide ABC transporter ATP-binding protein [Burkholderiales bacterium]
MISNVIRNDRPVLEIQRLTVALPRGADRSNAVENVNLTVRRGEIVCLLGESGSGKSVIAQSVMGLLPREVRPVAGNVLLEGENLLASTPARLRSLRGARMTMIFQEPMTALNPVMSAGAQVDEVLACHTQDPPALRRQRVLEMFAKVRLADPARMIAAYPHQLSGGQRQRIMIAMALMLDPALLIADEPTTALDVTTQAEILELIRTLQREHQTGVLFITHDFGVVAEVADRVAVLEKGRMVEVGAMKDVLHAPRHPYTRLLVDAVPSLDPATRNAPGHGKAVITVCNFSKMYLGGTFLRRRAAVRGAEGIDIVVRQGETVGIVGESGSGKSTVARCIARIIDPSSGTLELNGVKVNLAARADREFRQRVQIVFQDPYRSLNPRRTVGAAIIEGPMNFGANRADAWRRAEALMSLVRLDPIVLNRYPHEFSGGQRQRICIARALALDPHLLIADEAVSALDVSVQAQILALLADIQKRLKLALLFITHDLRVAAGICDRILVMSAGRIVEQGETRRVFESPSHPYTKALLAAAPGRLFRFGRKSAGS